MRQTGMALALGLILVNTLAAADYPSWRGEDRTGRSKETGLLKEWPSGGPKQAWVIDGIGDGYSTPSVADGRIYLVGTLENQEHLIALSEKDGKKLWNTEIGKPVGGHRNPKSTPTAVGDKLYVLSSDGNLVCAEAKTGKVAWSKNLLKDFQGNRGGWAYTESPLVDGDLMLCTPGGDEATIVALNKETGDLVWQSDLGGLPDIAKGRKKKPYSQAAYSSIVTAEIGGTKMYVQFLAGGVVGVDAKTGKLLWHYDAPANTTANCSTPIVHDGAVFAASAYGTGGGLAEITKTGDGFRAEQKWFLSKMQNHHGGVVRVGDYLYGTGGNTLLCVDWKTGEVKWSERSVGKGSLMYADGHLYVRSEQGPVALVEATPEEYREKGRFDQPMRSGKSSWPYPVVANGRLYLRDGDKLLAYDVKAE